MRTVVAEWGWCGFGRAKGGLFAGVCLGIVRGSWARGSLADAIRREINRG